jgi:hypothetical protein
MWQHSTWLQALTSSKPSAPKLRLDNVNPIVMDAEVADDNDTVVTVNNSWEPKEGVAISEGDPPPFISFNLDGPSNAQGKEKPSDTAELLKLHHRFGHILFKRLQEMAKQGTVPTQLAKCPISVCTAFMFAKATKRKWRDKPNWRATKSKKLRDLARSYRSTKWSHQHQASSRR